MLKFTLKRVFMGLVTLFIVSSLTFVLMEAVPGDPFQKEGKMSEAVYENLKAQYGLDKPYAQRYKMYMTNVLKGDFGKSMKNQTETVNEMISRGAPVSFKIGIMAFILSMVMGIALGSVAALYQNKAMDYIAMMLAIVGISIPSFVMATIMIQFVAKNVSFLPIGGWGSFKHMILPVVTLSFMPMASTARLMRSSMLEVLNQDYIKTARSKGISSFAVVVKHGIRNAILPIISQMGTTITGLLTGSFIVEKIFGVPGLGSFFIQSIVDRDYTLIMGITVFYSIILISMLLIVDILYVVIDPRIKLTGGRE